MVRWHDLSPDAQTHLEKQAYGCLLFADVAVAGVLALSCLHTPEFEESTHAHCARYVELRVGNQGILAGCLGAHVRVGSLDHQPGSRLGMRHGGMAPAVLPRPPCGEQRKGLKPIVCLRRSHCSRASAAGYEAVEHAGYCHPLPAPSPKLPSPPATLSGLKGVPLIDQ